MQGLFASLRGKTKLTEENLSEATRQVRLALLDADVSYSVVSHFIKKIKEKVVGDAVISKVSPGDHFIKVVHEELIELMGGVEVPITLEKRLTVVMLCGLQGAGKTTQAAKLAAFFIKKNKETKIMLAACDLQRPAAVEQLKILGAKVGAEVVFGADTPLKVAVSALDRAQKEGFDVLIVDTAGRLHIDEPLMEELQAIKKALCPDEVLFVASAATGQDAVKVAATFHEKIGVTGVILTMLDGTARAGAAVSIRHETGLPLKFEGVGEKIEDLRIFNPQSMADRILGMGDVINLVRQAEGLMGEKERDALEKKMLKGSFTYEDYLSQMGMIRKMGSLKTFLSMLPGMSGLSEVAINEQELYHMEAMISSMTGEERQDAVELVPSRRRRIALGSGTTVDHVNRMVKKFKQMKQFCKGMPGLKNQLMKGGMKFPKNIEEWMNKQ